MKEKVCPYVQGDITHWCLLAEKGQPPAVAKAANSGLTEDNWATFKDDDINF